MVRPLDDDEVKALALALLKSKTARDKQTKIGPSGIGNPCDYCVGLALTGHGQYRENPWWLGARVGTAVHSLMEHEIGKHTATPRAPEFEALRDAAVEERLFITNIEGYGNIYGNADLTLTSGNLIDWKTTKKDTVKKYRLDGIPPAYYVQQNLYAYGWNQIEPGIVKRCSLVFISRDGSGDGDVWVYSWDYDEQAALDAISRLDELWQFLHGGGDVESLPSDENCFYCQNILRRW